MTSVADETKVGDFPGGDSDRRGAAPRARGGVGAGVGRGDARTRCWRRRPTRCAGRSGTSGRPERLDTRAGHYERKLLTPAGEVTLQVPRLRKLPFETEIIERYRRRESSVEEALIEMYLAGVSVRRVEDITEALWGTAGQPQHGQRVEPEDLRDDRGLAATADRRRACLRVPGRDLAEAELGRRGERTLRCWWRWAWERRIPGNPGRCRGDEGGHGELAELPAVPEGAWAARA